MLSLNIALLGEEFPQMVPFHEPQKKDDGAKGRMPIFTFCTVYVKFE